MLSSFLFVQQANEKLASKCFRKNLLIYYWTDIRIDLLVVIYSYYYKEIFLFAILLTN